MKSKPAVVVRLADYRPPAFRIVDSALTLDLDFGETRVAAVHRVRRNPARADAPKDLALDLDELQVERVSIDGEPLAPSRYRVEDDRLVVFDAPDAFELGVENIIAPARNTALSGLYQSGDMLCTQCEAEGFRRITPAIDRPDNLGAYRVTLRADRDAFPLLLCNGNLIERGDCDARRHYAIWRDPFPKPTYLFAIVAGRLECMTDEFVTRGGRAVALRFFARARDIGKCAHAMASLKRAMAWDEQAYGREYDLDLYNVVAVGDFNMGAMENKSLNIFNTKYVLADPRMATDDDFEDVEAVIGHEYFHNWSGNRVTCRDWFQLSLKEGFTVFREQQFSADMSSAAVKRIADAAALRTHQFREDAGPMAHAVRPDSYIEINNFYTATVYSKGAEVVRMLHTLLGATAFRAGADLYFERHDGEAATTDDFVAAMADASGMDLSQFKNWYSQAGTPVVEVETDYDAARRACTITLSQHCPSTPQQPSETKAPFVIPIKAALFDRDGRRIHTNANLDDERSDERSDELLVLSEARQSFVFDGIERAPVASLLRGFSAPVELRHDLSTDELALLLSCDDDPFSRWEAGQKLFLGALLDGIERIRDGAEMRIADSDSITRAFEAALDQADDDPALHARILMLPSAAYVGEMMFSERASPIDPAAIFAARQGLKRHLADALRAKLLRSYHDSNARSDGAINAAQIGWRSLRDVCLDYLCALDDAESDHLAAALLAEARCMTDSVAALAALANGDKGDRQTLLDDFYRAWRDEPLVVDKWLGVQSCAPRADTLARVRELTRHEAFDAANPNKAYALLLGFSHANPRCFHAPDGAGYRFAAEWVARLDATNPQVGARLVSAFNHWRKYTPALKARMRETLESIAARPGLSRDVGEIVGKSLQN
ncbi:MAG: aminopeptidase N [bacterium]